MYTITRDDFKKIHNARVDFYVMVERLEGIVSDNISAKLRSINNNLMSGLSNMYEQERAEFDRKNKHYESVASKYKFKTAWSMYEIDNLDAESPYEHNVVLYDGITESIRKKGSKATWLELWKAADKVIRKNGDTHHIFIESFYPSDNETLEISTGS